MRTGQNVCSRHRVTSASCPIGRWRATIYKLGAPITGAADFRCCTCASNSSGVSITIMSPAPTPRSSVVLFELEACQRQLHFYMAALRRWVAWRTTFIGVTGSCGKTTVTNLVGVILSHKGKCSVCVDCNYDVDVATTVLALPNCTNFCIQEVATIRPGMIASSSSILKPSIAIVTTIGSDHYVKFRSLEATSQEKGVLVERLPSWGTAILNADDPNVIDMARRTPARVLTFGLSPNADVRAIDVSSAWPDRLALTVVYNGKAVRVPTRFVGAHSTTSVLAAIACGIACGVDLATCVEAIARAHPVFGRYSVHERSDGAAYVLDTHKAPFWTIASSYAFIGSARATRKTMVFGTISDYPGERSRRYRRIAREALQVADRVVFVGPSAGHTSRLRQERFDIGFSISRRFTRQAGSSPMIPWREN